MIVPNVDNVGPAFALTLIRPGIKQTPVYVYWSVFHGGNTTISEVLKNGSNVVLFVRVGGDSRGICLNDQAIKA